MVVGFGFGLNGSSAKAADPWIVFEGGDGPGKGKHIVLISGDDEYRSEEALPQLAKIGSWKRRCPRGWNGIWCRRDAWRSTGSV